MNTVIVDGIGAVVSAGVGSLAAYLTHKGLLQKVATFLGAHVGEITKGAETLVTDLVSSPAAKVAEVHLQSQLDSALTDIRKTTLGQYAAQGLLAMGKSLSELTPGQVEALTLHISTLVPTEWHVTKMEITQALDAVQKASEVVAQVPYIVSANQFAADIAAAATAQTMATA